MDAVCPHVRVVLVIEPARFPDIELLAKLAVDACDRRGREWRMLAEQRPQRRLEVALRKPFEPELMKRAIQTWKSAGVLGQHARFGGCPAHARASDGDRAGRGGDQALGVVAVAVQNRR